ncbi:methylmalonyl Co-A mutase-associated GTPase MeaB [Halogeometricum luteum]|uniref:Methylmalonyl Co-A mutase-associated GTPase MeaB n=1 Tax=Halogeometricum luteum TaxID=2950537 RepID=A0ABU2FY63_9EURY|nr:methylmalonyl Co-A mutase-associated GTPase MeaB [Halogeometricum sp. S3BR5-2]MDS0293472.1 methylmalonyl Co-A mutase-associated GTPase MeaB [Halogeometricum sp. S3BR5-2]
MSHAEDRGETRTDELVSDLLDGKHRALARAITKIENRSPGYRELVSRLHAHTGDADVIGITGSPGAGKSTLVDKLAKAYREEGLTVGVIAVDPSSPYTGGAVLGDRIRMASNVGDMDVFFRSMSARGQLGGLSTATSDAVKALDAFGKDKILVETVGAGQNEVDVVRTADTVTVLVQPGSGDDVQMLKAGILEIGDVFVVNKADMDGVNRTVAELEEMIHLRDNPGATLDSGHRGAGHHGVDAGLPDDVSGHGGADGSANGERGHGDGADGDGESDGADSAEWEPAVVETVATSGDGVDELVETLAAHADYLAESGMREEKARSRYAEEIRQLLRNDANALLKEELDRRGGAESLAEAVAARETDPYAVADEVFEPLRDCVESKREGE